MWHLIVFSDLFLAIFGRTELRIGASKAKHCEKFDFEVRFYVAPRNPEKKTKELAGGRMECTDGRTDRCTDRWMDGRTDRRIDGRTYVRPSVHPYVRNRGS